MTTMTVETLAPGDYVVAITTHGRYRLQLHRDAQNAAHVDAFNTRGICGMGRVKSLLEAQMEFDRLFQEYDNLDSIMEIKEGI